MNRAEINRKAREAYSRLTPSQYAKLLKKKRERWANRTPAQRTRANEAAARRREHEDPRKRAARKAVWDAIDHGRLQRGLCEVCGASNVEAHHDDYDKPLLVRWRCTTHHRRLHKEGF